MKAEKSKQGDQQDSISKESSNDMKEQDIGNNDSEDNETQNLFDPSEQELVIQAAVLNDELDDDYQKEEPIEQELVIETAVLNDELDDEDQREEPIEQEHVIEAEIGDNDGDQREEPISEQVRILSTADNIFHCFSNSLICIIP